MLSPQVNDNRYAVPLGALAIELPEVPIIDISAVHDGTEKEKRDLAELIGYFAKKSGFFYIENHGVSESSYLQLERQAKVFFEQPLAKKMQCDIALSPSHSGYVPLTEKGLYDDEQNERRYEAFDISEETEISLRDRQNGNIFSGKNTWPQLPSFKQAVSRYTDEIQDLSMKLCELFELALGLPANFFKRRMNSSVSQLRLIHYIENTSRVTDEDNNMGAHTDYELFTILRQTSNALQTQSAEGLWIDAPVISNTFVINIGDLMEVFSNGIFKSNVHRVVNCNTERYSFPYFVAPDFDTLVRPQACCVHDHRPIMYNSISAGHHISSQITRDFSYLRKRLRSGEHHLPLGLPSNNPLQDTMIKSHITRKAY